MLTDADGSSVGLWVLVVRWPTERPLFSNLNLKETSSLKNKKGIRPDRNTFVVTAPSIHGVQTLKGYSDIVGRDL